MLVDLAVADTLESSGFFESRAEPADSGEHIEISDCCDHLLLFFANLYNVFAEPVRYHTSLNAALESLRPCFTAARRRFMTRVAVVTGRQELRIGVVCPDVGGLHSLIPILAVCSTAEEPASRSSSSCRLSGSQ